MTLDVIALEVRQDEGERRVTTSKNEKGEYLVAITEDTEIPVDTETCTIYTTLDINDILNSNY